MPKVYSYRIKRISVLYFYFFAIRTKIVENFWYKVDDVDFYRRQIHIVLKLHHILCYTVCSQCLNILVIFHKQTIYTAYLKKYLQSLVKCNFRATIFTKQCMFCKTAIYGAGATLLKCKIDACQKYTVIGLKRSVCFTLFVQKMQIN